MTIDIIRLKALATAAAANQYDSVALNDYGTALPPATMLGLIAEIERHRQINAEGCKPDSNILLSGMPCAGAAASHSLNKAEGCKPDHINPPHQGAAALRADIERGNRIQLAMALDLSAIAQALGIPPEEQEGGAEESIAIIEEMRDRLWSRDALFSNLLDHEISVKARARINDALSSTEEPSTLNHAALDVLAERRRQVTTEGWTPEQDDEYQNFYMAEAAHCYALGACNYGFGDIPPVHWPWDRSWWKNDNPRRSLVKAGALILAEIERLDRQTACEVQP